MKTETILDIQFASAPLGEVMAAALKCGLVVVPSGPGLAVDLRHSEEYRRAVTSADLALPDSGAMVLLWRLFKRKSILRVSGLRFLELLLQQEALKPAGETFWVHPSEGEQSVNEIWLTSKGFEVRSCDSYVAPFYPKEGIADIVLFDQLQTVNPKVIVLCIGGGVQERLGYWLREQYQTLGKKCPAIICTGAAIGFLSGNQVNIPSWADRHYLGWLFRCLYEPRKFIPRYWAAIPLAYLIWKYGEKLPPLAE